MFLKFFYALAFVCFGMFLGPHQAAACRISDMNLFVERDPEFIKSCESDGARVARIRASQDDLSPLHWIAIFGRNPDMVDTLVDLGVPVNLVNETWGTPIALAGRHWNYPLMRQMLAHGGDITSRNNEDGMTPLHYMALRGELSELESLNVPAEVLANVRDEQERTLLHVACFALNEPNLDLIEWLVQQGVDVNALDRGGNSALITAASGRSGQLVSTLFALGAQTGLSPEHDKRLWLALSRARDVAVIEAVASAGLDLDRAVDNQGNRPLHILAEGGSANGVAILLEAGADPSVKNGKGLPPASLIKKSNKMHGTDVYWDLVDGQ